MSADVKSTFRIGRLRGSRAMLHALLALVSCLVTLGTLNAPAGRMLAAKENAPTVVAISDTPTATAAQEPSSTQSAGSQVITIPRTGITGPAETTPTPPALRISTEVPQQLSFQATGSQVVTIPAPAKQDRESTAIVPRLEAELITIRPNGFHPTQITRPAGPVILAIDNRSGLRLVTLRLDIEGGPRLREVQVPRSKLDWRGLLNLVPGRYILTEANHPNWICRITIR